MLKRFVWICTLGSTRGTSRDTLIFSWKSSWNYFHFLSIFERKIRHFLISLWHTDAPIDFTFFQSLIVHQWKEFENRSRLITLILNPSRFIISIWALLSVAFSHGTGTSLLCAACTCMLVKFWCKLDVLIDQSLLNNLHAFILHHHLIHLPGEFNDFVMTTYFPINAYYFHIVYNFCMRMELFILKFYYN